MGTYAEALVVSTSLPLAAAAGAAPTVDAGAAVSVTADAALSLVGLSLTGGTGGVFENDSGDTYQVGGVFAVEAGPLSLEDCQAATSTPRRCPAPWAPRRAR